MNFSARSLRVVCCVLCVTLTLPYLARADSMYFSKSKGVVLKVQREESAEEPPRATLPIPLRRRAEPPALLESAKAPLAEAPRGGSALPPRNLSERQRDAGLTALRAGIPTFINTYYNPRQELMPLSWKAALSSAAVGSLFGAGLEIYEEVKNKESLNYRLIIETGGLVGTASFAGVISGQWIQRAALINMGALGAKTSAAQLTASFLGDAAGSFAAAAVFSLGSYGLGDASPAGAREGLKRGAVGGLLMAAGKAGVMAAFPGVVHAAALGPYAVTYLAALGAVFVTDAVFTELEKREEGAMLNALLDARLR